MINKRIIDKRVKEKFLIDDAYLNGMAKKCGWQATLVYLCLCRHANKNQECFPSIKLMQEKLGVGRKTVIRGIQNLKKYNIIQVESSFNKKTGAQMNNTYILIDKSEWKEYNPVSKMDKGECLIDTGGVPNKEGEGGPIRDYKETHNKETHTRDTKVITFEVNEIIELFKEVNPSYKELFKRKNQRYAVQRLLNELGKEKVMSAISYLPKTNSMNYAPIITTPVQLEEKIGALRAFVQKEMIKINNKKIIKL
jgi:hypothetical protein